MSKEEGEVKDCAPLGKFSDEHLILQKAATVINNINLKPSLLGDANKGRQVTDASNHDDSKCLAAITGNGSDVNNVSKVVMNKEGEGFSKVGYNNGNNGKAGASRYGTIGDQNFSSGNQNLNWNGGNKGWTARGQNGKWNRGSVSHWNQQKN